MLAGWASQQADQAEPDRGPPIEHLVGPELVEQAPE
jgi:hypothetical protein